MDNLPTTHYATLRQSCIYSSGVTRKISVNQMATALYNGCIVKIYPSMPPDVANMLRALNIEEWHLRYIQGGWFLETVDTDGAPLYQQISEIFLRKVITSTFIDIVHSFGEGGDKTIRNALSLFQQTYGKTSDEDVWPEPEIVQLARKVSLRELQNVQLPYIPSRKTLQLINLLFSEAGLHQMFILYGAAGSGKSTDIHLIRSLFGYSTTYPCTLEQLCKDKFCGYNAAQYRLVCNDDISNAEIKSAELKNFISGGYSQVEAKGVQPIKIKWQSRFLFACNELPRFEVYDNGIMRRLKIIRYTVPFTRENNRQLNLDKYPYSTEQLLKVFLMAKHTDISHWIDDFYEDTYSSMVEGLPLYRYIRDGQIDLRYTGNTPYMQYRDAAKGEGYTPMTRVHFDNTLNFINTKGEILKYE